MGVAPRLVSVPVEFLSDEQVAAYGRFDQSLAPNLGRLSLNPLRADLRPALEHVGGRCD